MPIPLPSRKAWATLAAITAPVLFFLREALFEGRVFYERDLHLQWYGQMESFARSVTSGSWPLWDPYVSFGQPLLANLNNELLYPPTWLNLLMRPWTYYTLFLGGHLILAGWGVVLLGGRWGVSRAGSIWAGVLWIASGPLLSLGNAWNHLAAASFIPFVLLASEEALAPPSLRGVALWGVASALQILAGSPDVFVMTTLLALACASRFIKRGAKKRLMNGSILLLGALALGLALALSAAQWLPSLELASRSARWHLGGQERTYWSIHPLSLVQLLVPLLWYEVPLSAPLRSAIFEGREPFLFSIYVGVPAVLLALAALVWGRGRLRFILGGAAALSGLVSLGRHAPIYGFLVAVLPPLKTLRFPAKALILTGFCLAMLAGQGYDAWRTSLRRSLSWLLWGPLGALALLGATLLFVLRFHADALAPYLPPPAPGVSYLSLLGVAASKVGLCTALSVVALGLLAVRRKGETARAVSAGLLAALGLLDLAFEHRQLNHTAPQSLYTVRPEAAASIDQRDMTRLYVFDYSAAEGRSQAYLGRDTPYVVSGYRRDSPSQWAEALALRFYLVPPIGAGFRLFDSYSKDHLGIQPTPLLELNTLFVLADGTPLQTKLLQMGAVSQVLALHTAGMEGLLEERTFPGPFLEKAHLFRVPDPHPRTYVVGDAVVADGEEALKVIASPTFDGSREIVLPEGVPEKAGPGFQGRSRILVLKPDRVQIESESTLPGYVVLADAYDPGWRCEVDGRDRPLLRADLAFRAVSVSSGRHIIDLKYRPRAVLYGAAVSAVALLLTGVLLTRRAAA